MVGSVLNAIIPWAGAGIVAFYLYSSVATLAGRYTFAQIGVSFLGDFKLSEAFAYLFGTGGVAYGLRQRKLRENNIERMAARLSAYETVQDPKRSSSRLTPRGQTRPEDGT